MCILLYIYLEPVIYLNVIEFRFRSKVDFYNSVRHKARNILNPNGIRITLSNYNDTGSM